MTTVIRASDNWDSSIPSNVVSATNNTEVAIASVGGTGSWIDIGLSVSITLASTASKVKLEYAISDFYIGTTNLGISFKLVRDSTALFTPSTGYATYTGFAPMYLSSSNIEIDSPSSTSPLTYKVQARGHGTGTIYVSRANLFNKTLIATEIAG